MIEKTARFLILVLWEGMRKLQQSEAEKNKYCYGCGHYRPYPNNGNCESPAREFYAYTSLVTGAKTYPIPAGGLEHYRREVCQGTNWQSLRAKEALFYMNNPNLTKKQGVI